MPSTSGRQVSSSQPRTTNRHSSVLALVTRHPVLCRHRGHAHATPVSRSTLKTFLLCTLVNNSLFPPPRILSYFYSTKTLEQSSTISMKRTSCCRFVRPVGSHDDSIDNSQSRLPRSSACKCERHTHQLNRCNSFHPLSLSLSPFKRLAFRLDHQLTVSLLLADI